MRAVVKVGRKRELVLELTVHANKIHTKPASPKEDSTTWGVQHYVERSQNHIQQHTQDGAILLFRYKWFLVRYIVWLGLKTCGFSLSFQLLFHLEKHLKWKEPGKIQIVNITTNAETSDYSLAN